MEKLSNAIPVRFDSADLAAINRLHRKHGLLLPDIIRRSVRHFYAAVKERGFDELLSETTKEARLVPLPVFGPVPAGEPSQVLDSEEWQDVPGKLAEGAEAILIVSGTSMNNARPIAYHDGDRVRAVRRDPKDGDVVAAEVDDEGYCLKRLVQEKGHWLLKCESTDPRHKDPVPCETMTVRWVVLGKL